MNHDPRNWEATLDAVLARYPADCQPTAVEFLGSGGGLSGARIWRLQTSRGKLGLRLWPRHAITPQRLAWIQSVAWHAHVRGFSHLPSPVANRRGEGCVVQAGEIWSLETWLAGEADSAGPPSPGRIAAALQALAHYHRATFDYSPCTASQGPSPNALRRLGQLREAVRIALFQLGSLTPAAGQADWHEAARAWCELLPALAPRVIGQLEDAAQPLFRLQPCLRDIWREHVLFVGNDVTGIVDLGAMRMDHPATDIARLLASYAVDDSALWSQGIAAYVVYQPLEDVELQLIAALDAASSLLIPWNWFQWVLLEQRTFDANPRDLLQRAWTAIERMEAMYRRGGGSLILA